MIPVRPVYLSMSLVNQDGPAALPFFKPFSALTTSYSVISCKGYSTASTTSSSAILPIKKHFKVLPPSLTNLEPLLLYFIFITLYKIYSLYIPFIFSNLVCCFLDHLHFTFCSIQIPAPLLPSPPPVPSDWRPTCHPLAFCSVWWPTYLPSTFCLAAYHRQSAICLAAYLASEGLLSRRHVNYNNY